MNLTYSILFFMETCLVYHNRIKIAMTAMVIIVSSTVFTCVPNSVSVLFTFLIYEEALKCGTIETNKSHSIKVETEEKKI